MALIAGEGDDAFTTPPGWTQVGQWTYGGQFVGVVVGVFRKWWNGDAGSVSFSSGSITSKMGLIHSIIGANTADPIHVGPAVTGHTGESSDFPSLATTKQSLIYMQCAMHANTGFSGGSGDLWATSATSDCSYVVRTTSFNSGTFNPNDVQAPGADQNTRGISFQVALGGISDFTPSGISVPVRMGSFTGLNETTPPGISVPVAVGDFEGESQFDPEGIALPVTMGEFLGVSTTEVFEPEGIAVPVTMGAFRLINGESVGGAPSVRNVTTAVAGSSDLVLLKPAGTDEDDVLVAVIYGAEAEITPPLGWTLLRREEQSVFIVAYSKLAGFSEPADYTFTLSETQPVAGALIAVKGAMEDDSFDFVLGQVNGAPALEAPISGPAPEGPNRLVIYTAAAPTPGSWSAPSGYDEQADVAVDV